MSSYTNAITKDAEMPTAGQNPEVVIGTDVPYGSPVGWARKIYTRSQYCQQDLKPMITNTPMPKDYFKSGMDTLFVYTLGTQIAKASSMPSFMTQDSYASSFAKMPSGFLTPQKSLMPKMLVPSQNIIDNGVWETGDCGVFNWAFDKKEDTLAYTWVTTQDAQSMTVIKGAANPDEDIKPLEMKVTLDPAKVYLLGEGKDFDKRNMIGGGAFQMVFSFFDLNMMGDLLRAEGNQPPNPSLDTKFQPSITFELGDLHVAIESDGRCVASWKTGQKNSAMVNLINGIGEECIPQAKLNEKDAKTYVLTVYPCWNGVVIQSGVQNAQNLISSSSAYLPVIKEASIFDFADSTRIPNGQEVSFNPTNPDQVFVKMKKLKLDVTPNLGNSTSKLILQIKNCSCKVAFAPIFFHTKMKMDHVIVGNRDTTNFRYAYKAYPIWTDNNTSYVLETDSGAINFEVAKDAINEPYKLIKGENTLQAKSSGRYERIAGELFGCIVEMSEEKIATTPSAPGAYQNGLNGWKDYITNVSISNRLDSANGNITFDKYGATNGLQDFEIQQCVGALSLSVNGCYNTNGKASGDTSTSLLFRGYSWQTSESKNNAGADVTITLMGVEKRLEDGHLVNPPIFDGYKFGEVVDYLCGEAGVVANLASADPNVQLMMSTDINSVIYNWTTGMEIKQALDQICSDTAHNYTPIDGILVFYKIKEDGTPDYSGNNWDDYDGTKIQSIETNPDFENIRNKIWLIAMKKPSEGQLKNFQGDWPVFPISSLRKNTTNPIIPWDKAITYTLPGFMSEDDLDKIADNIQRSTKKYELLGSTTVPGVNVKVLDTFMHNLIVTEVNHTIDLVGKTWTTSLSFMRKT